MTLVDPAAIQPSLTDCLVPLHHMPVLSMSSDLSGELRSDSNNELLAWNIFWYCATVNSEFMEWKQLDYLKKYDCLFNTTIVRCKWCSKAVIKI